MNKLLAPIVLSLAVLAPSAVFAAERTVTLEVQNMYCAACPHIVKASLEAVPGVSRVTISFEAKTASVTYDDVRTGVKALTAATTNAGYPSKPRS